MIRSAHESSLAGFDWYRRETWDAAGVIVDDLASRGLVLNLPASGTGLGEWLSGAAALGTPFYATPAFHRLAAAVVAGGGSLSYHGDFDWPGISIAASVMSRHGAAPWRMALLADLGS